MRVEKTYFDYGRMPDWIKQILSHCASGSADGSLVVELSSDYPRYSGYIKSQFSGLAVVQVVRGRVFRRKWDNMRYMDVLGDEPSINLSASVLLDKDISILILDTTYFLSEIVNEYCMYISSVRVNGRLILPLEIYNIERSEREMALASIVLAKSIGYSGECSPQYIHNMFFCLPQGRRDIVRFELLKRATLEYFVDIADYASARDFEKIINMLYVHGSDLPEGMTIHKLSYILERCVATDNPKVQELITSVLRDQSRLGSFRHVASITDLRELHDEFYRKLGIGDLNELIESIKNAGTLTALELILLKEQLRLKFIQEYVSPLFFRFNNAAWVYL